MGRSIFIYLANGDAFDFNWVYVYSVSAEVPLYLWVSSD